MEIERLNNLPARPPIAPDQVQSSAAVQQAARALRDASRATPTGPVDKVQISEESRGLARAQEAVEAAPDIRTELVAQIREQIAAGTYVVPAETVARKLLGED